MTDLDALVQIHDLDLMLEQVEDAAARERLLALGLETEGVGTLRRARARCIAALDRRWVRPYERALGRYGRAVAAVRDRVCQGCFITLPTSAAPVAGSPMMCESCGRLLYWPLPPS